MSSCPDIRLAQETDVPQLKTLWLRCFPEDTRQDVDAFFQTVWPLADCLIALSPEAPERPASMAFLLPAEVCFSGQRLPVRYLYAGCTAPEFRGRGCIPPCWMPQKPTQRRTALMRSICTRPRRSWNRCTAAPDTARRYAAQMTRHIALQQTPAPLFGSQLHQ